MPTTVVFSSINVSGDQETIIRQGGKIVALAVNDSKFAAELNAAQFSGGTQFRLKNGNIVSKSKAEILTIVRDGIERATASDSEIDMAIVVKPQPKGVVGSTYLGKQPIMPAIWFVNQCVAKGDGVSMARHLIHEWLHVAGFFHQSSGPNQGDVPYVVGDIVRRIAKDLDKALVDDEVRPFLNEDSLAASWLDQAEDEVDFGSDLVTTKVAAAAD